MALRQWYLGLATVAAALLPMAGTAVADPVLAPPGTHVTIDFQGFTTENPGTVGTGADGGSCGALGCTETTWGAGFVKASNDFSTSQNYFTDSPSERLAFVLYGVADKSIVDNGNGTFTINNTGATNTTQWAAADGLIHLDIYSYAGDRPCFTTAAACVQVTDRTGFSTVHGITDIPGGSLYAQIVLVPGILPDGSVTLQQTANANTAPADGGGSFYANCVSGPGCDQFVNNAFLSNGFLADLFARFGFTVAFAAFNEAGWLINISDPVFAFGRIPEPASLAMLGSALVFFGAAVTWRRRKMSS